MIIAFCTVGAEEETQGRLGEVPEALGLTLY